MMRPEHTRESPPGYDGFVGRNLGKTYGAISVLRGVDLDVRAGECVALLGENGAGKSTVAALIGGITPPDAGARMWWRERPYAPQSPADALHAGIGLIHQELRLLPQLTIAENVFVGRLVTTRGRVDMPAMAERAQTQLRRLGLDISPYRHVGTLSIAAQQQVEIAKALTLDAKLLILDEPTAALGDAEAQRLFEQIARLKTEGVSFLYVSHRLAEIAEMCDRIVVLRDGETVARHETAQIPQAELVRNMVGRSVDRLFPTIPAPADDAPVALSVRHLTAPDRRFSNLSFDVRAGEVLGLAGIAGAGRTEAMRGVMGLDPVASGDIAIGGTPVRITSPIDAIREGVVMVPDDRKALGLVLQHSVWENLMYSNFDRVAPDGWLSPARALAFAEELIHRLKISGRAAQTAGSLSGGNQQKVVIAKWLARRPKVMILDEPTRGVDVGARAQIYETIAELTRQGMAAIIISSDLTEVLGLAHRVLVLANGETRGVLTRAEADAHRVMALAVS
jgi:ribose transport system ATP-binding protein